MTRKFISQNLLSIFLALLCANPPLSAKLTSPLPTGERVGREAIYNFNPDWLFYRGDVKGAEEADFNDSSWETVSLPHTVQLMPAEGSGCRNYQGVVWYRKHFRLPEYTNEKHSSLQAKGQTIGNTSQGSWLVSFEAIMGKQKFFVNGKLVKEHEGGYLPININLTETGIKPGDDIVIAVMADNSDDKSYPPGKSQMTLDFCYHGGIYRDAWLIKRPAVYITDNIDANKVAGGGIFVHYANISEKLAEVYADVNVCNSLSTSQNVTIQCTLTDKLGKAVKQWQKKINIPANQDKSVTLGGKISNPSLWSPENPYLYKLTTELTSTPPYGGEDKVDLSIGIRSFAFKGKEGFWLNGKRYRQFVGANRHQDFAYVGNAVPNSQQCRDVQRLKEAGINIIRVAHYPQDPAFMEACDELGIFVIVATPGWQFWNDDPAFARKVQQNTRDIIRRDRNHPCVLMWEPILNETRYPEDFALEALKITREEYPYPYRPVAAADLHSAGVLANYDVIYAWPGDDEKTDGAEARCIELNKNMFTREFGEYVDDWYAHNNLNRASRSWGERPMLMQALSLSNTIADQHRTTGIFLGGCQWHPFDHQRGYHPDPYWGGIYDAFRQPKTAYYMFHSQIPVDRELIDNGQSDPTKNLNTPLSTKENTCGETCGAPYVYIANDMTQFSDNDVIVFSNCDSVRLTAYDGAESYTLPVLHEKVLPDYGEKEVISFKEAMRNDDVAPYNAPVIFKDIWNFWKGRNLSYRPKNWQAVNLVAEGIVDGKVVVTAKRMPSRRTTKLRLFAEERGRKLVADGSDFIVVVCEVTDDNGNVRRLAKDQIKFSIDGPAEIIGDGTDIGANPRQVEWGTAPILVRSTTSPGKIRIHADVLYPGEHTPKPADLEIESVPSTIPLIRGTKTTAHAKSRNSNVQDDRSRLTDEARDKMLQEVQDQQADFGISK